MNCKVWVGCYMVVILIVMVGVLLILDKWWGIDYVYEMVDWWLLLLIVLGVEYILLFLWMCSKKKIFVDELQDEKVKICFRLDVKGILVFFVLMVVVFIVIEQDYYMYLWNRVSFNLGVVFMDYSQVVGYMQDKGMICVFVGMDIFDFVVQGVNGDILVQCGDMEEIEVCIVVWVDKIFEVEVKVVVDVLFVEMDGIKVIYIIVMGKIYGDNDKIQFCMNMMIMILDDWCFNLDICIFNGVILLNWLEVISSIVVEMGNGCIWIMNVVGDIMGKMLNGDVIVVNVMGNVDLDSNWGDMKV